MKKNIKIGAFSISSILLIIVGSLFWSLTMVKSGLRYSYGIGFWGPNGHDGIWHISVIESLSRGTWEMPVFSGEVIKNYHVGYDLIVSFINKLTLIPVSSLYFQIIPPLLALALGIVVYKFVEDWKKSKTQAFWATFFLYFGGSFGWIVSLARNGAINGESMFWSQQSISTLINPPFALSLLFMLIGMLIFKNSIKVKDKKLITLSAFFFGVLIQIKVYAGILALGGLLLAGMFQFIKKRDFSVLKVFLGALVISILLFNPLNREVADTIIFKPFWFLETMMQFSDRLNWQKFGEAMVNYKLGGIWVKGITAYFAAFLIFIIGNFGTRLLSFKEIINQLKEKKGLTYIEVFVYSVIAFGIITPMLFVQRGTAWNTIQFFYYSLIFSGILAGVALGKIFEKQKSKGINISLIIVSFVVFITIPTTIGTLKHYLPSRPPAKISNEELQALWFLASQPQGNVLTMPFNKALADAAIENPPRPLYLYESTAYVSAISKKAVYLEDEVNLEITGYSWKKRRRVVENFFEDMNADYRRNFLVQNNISYMYLVNDRTDFDTGILRIKKIFQNNLIDIYKVE